VHHHRLIDGFAGVGVDDGPVVEVVGAQPLFACGRFEDAPGNGRGLRAADFDDADTAVTQGTVFLLSK
jgi:hypothetical protein